MRASPPNDEARVSEACSRLLSRCDEASEKVVQSLVDAYLERRRRGERPSRGDFAEVDPRLLDDVWDCLPVMAALESLRRTPRSDSNFGPEASPGPESPVTTGVPCRLGDYRIVREIGRGGMGIVYEAEQESLHRPVALKVLPAFSLLDERRFERFRREAQAAARLHHPNIVTVYGFGQEAGVFYYAMQLVAGATLDAVLPDVARWRTDGGSGARESSSADGSSSSISSIALRLVESNCSPFDPRGSSPDYSRNVYSRNVAAVCRDLATALAYAHHSGVVHRDIKPSNILLDSHGHAYLADFGLAKVFDVEDLTRTGELVGTLRYMAPERLQGSQDDPRGDIYSLGLVLDEMLTLQPPFAGADRAAVLCSILEGNVPGPRDIDPTVPGTLDAIARRATARDPGDRHQSAAELAADLERFLLEGPQIPRLAEAPARLTAPLAKRAAPGAGRRRRWLVAGAFLLGAVLMITILSSRRFDSAPKSEPTVGPSSRVVAVGRKPQRVVGARLRRGKPPALVTVNPVSNDLSVVLDAAASEPGPARLVPVGDLPVALVAADLNGDGVDDIAVALFRPGGIAILPGDGAGGLGAPAKVRLPGPPRTVVATDLDGDDAVDLAAASDTGRLWVLPNRGGGRFDAPAGDAELKTASGVTALLAADVDDDRAPDLIGLGAEQGDLFSWHRNAGKGRFEPARKVPGPPLGLSCVAVDLRRNGGFNLVGTGWKAASPEGKERLSGEVWIVRGGDGGSLQPVQVQDVAFPAENIAAADIDGDGDPDLVVSGGANSVLVLRNDRGERFVRWGELTVGEAPTGVALLDHDGDRRMDLAAAGSASNDVTVWFDLPGVLARQESPRAETPATRGKSPAR
jgi:serine/threonine protein kinase